MTTPYGAVSLSGELDKLARAASGERNNTLNTTWFKVCQLIEANHVDKAEAEHRFIETARLIGLTEGEIRKTMASGEQGASHKGRANVPDPSTFLQPNGRPSGRVVVAENIPADIPDYSDLYLTRSGLADLPPPEPLIDGVLDKRTLFSITGRGGTYKSFFALSWLASAATGVDWLGRPVARCKTLYIVGEGAYGLDSRLSAWETAWGTEIADEWFHVRRVPVNLYRRLSDLADLYERIRAQQYGLVIFDTLQRNSAGADLDKGKDAGLVVATLADLQRASPDSSIGFVAHTGKDDDKGTRGSSALEDDLDIVWRLSRDDDSETVQACQRKRKDGPVIDLIELRPDPQPGTGSFTLGRDTPMAGVDAKSPKYALPLLIELGKLIAGEGLSATRLIEAMGANWKSYSTAAEYLLDQGWVRRVGKGSHVRLKITDAGRTKLADIDENGFQQPASKTGRE